MEMQLVPDDGVVTIYEEQPKEWVHTTIVVDMSGAVSDHHLMDMWLAAQRNDKTRRLYKRAAEYLLESLPTGLRGCKLVDWQKFEDDLVKRYRLHSAITIANSCRSFFMYAQRCGYIGLSPAHVHRPPAAPHQKSSKELTEEEVDSLIKGARRQRDKVLLEVMYTTGCRAEEVAGMQWRDCRQKGLHVVIQVMGKGSRVRSLQLPKGASRRLMEMKTLDSVPEDYVFSTDAVPHPHPWRKMKPASFNYIVREAARRAGITKDVSPHWFRHAYAQHARARGISKDDIQDALGHQSQSTTEGYLAAHEGLMLSADFITERD